MVGTKGRYRDDFFVLATSCSSVTTAEPLDCPYDIIFPPRCQELPCFVTYSWGPSHDLREAISPTSSQMWNPIPWRVTEAKWAGHLILVNDTRRERCQGLWGRFPLFGFFLSGLVARNGRYGKNICLIGALELLIALSPPPLGLPAT